MKALVFLLVLANLLFYAFSAGYLGRSEQADEGRINQQVHPERMRIVSRGEPPATPLPKAENAGPEAPASENTASEAPVEPPKVEAAKPEPAKPEPLKPEAKPAEAAKPVPARQEESKAAKSDEPAETGRICMTWERLSISDADRLGAAFSEKFKDFALSRKAVNGDNPAWWVYIPPLPEKADADKKAGELRAFGVTDFFQIQEGPNRNAISLGVFSAEKGAQERLADLKSQGVRSARISVRPGAMVPPRNRPSARNASMVNAVPAHTTTLAPGAAPPAPSSAIQRSAPNWRMS